MTNSYMLHSARQQTEHIKMQTKMQVGKLGVAGANETGGYRAPVIRRPSQGCWPCWGSELTTANYHI